MVVGICTQSAPGQEPEVLTSVSDECSEGNCENCRGVFKRDNGESIFCVHECHMKCNHDTWPAGARNLHKLREGRRSLGRLSERTTTCEQVVSDQAFQAGRTGYDLSAVLKALRIFAQQIPSEQALSSHQISAARDCDPVSEQGVATGRY